ncbi:cadmium resistance transporter [Couchioplanes caeruleus]|uniref:cadmium resistance transporter n=1 Tax=Couchioplanes caeruleus TaxID=56438 RepID=UPI0020C0CA7F|nr:cadmium resistance transporter [Couchioplanes caeruleus]UQU63202.1 cadmium resistance transporter [Couchioplanes caeruleus]
MGEIMAAAAGVFAGTNVDDLVVLTVLFLSARASGRPRPWHIWVGQYAGIATLVAVSAVAALGLTLVPDRWVGLLGLVPIALGVRGLIGAVRDRGDGPPEVLTAANAFAVAGVTVANGADNIAVYTPVFRSLGIGGSVVTCLVFAALVAVWCAVASWLGSHRRVIEVVRRYGHWLVPLVFVAIGVVILVESGVLGRLT